MPKKVNSILILSNCPDFDFLGSGYVIHQFKLQLKIYFNVFYFDTRDYEILKYFSPRFNIYRQSIGKLLFLIKLLIIQRKKIDIVEFWGGDSFLAIIFLNIFYNKILIIHHSNGLESKYEPIMNKLDTNKKWYHFNLMKLYDINGYYVHGIITTTKNDAEWSMQRYSTPSIDVYPCLNDQFLNLDYNIEQKKDIIGYVGTWLPKKGIDLIISDLPKLLVKFPNYKLRLIGVGDQFDLNKYFPLNIHSRIEVIPFIVNKSDLLHLYQEIKVLILPSRAESFGIVTLEAMACSCAIVASNMGFAADLEDGQDAILLNELVSGELYSKLSLLLSNNDLLNLLSINGHKKVKHLRWSEAGEKLAKIYNHWLIQHLNKYEKIIL